MPMPPYPIYCLGCTKPAVYKIASHWSDGITRELKTYALVCADCLEAWFQSSRKKQKECRLVPGETLGPPGIFQMAHGKRDRQLEQLPELEQQLVEAGTNGSES